MNDHELDAVIAQTATITDEQVARLPLQVAGSDLLETIMSTSTFAVATIEATTASDGGAEAPRAQRRRAPSPRRRLGLAAAGVLLVATLGVAFTSVGGGSDKAWAAPLVEFAESSPRLLLDGSGWEVTRADQYGEGEGEMTFSSGERAADLFWRTGSYADWASDRANGAARVESRTVLGHEAQISQYAATDDYTALWLDGERTIEFRAVADSYDDFVGLIDGLRVVDVDAWLSAMPDDVIQSTERSVVVRQMLLGVPVPEGFDVARLQSAAGIRDRYQLGADVTGAVGCAWTAQWVDATATGDVARAGQAAAAMATSHEWPILVEMAEEGAWSQVFWTVADALGDGGVTDGGTDVATFYEPALGCHRG